MQWKWKGNFVKLPIESEVLESHLINCIDIGGTCNCTCTSCVYKGLCRCVKCRCNTETAFNTLQTELYEEPPSDYMIG